MLAVRAVTCACLLLGACSFTSQNPHDQRREWQEGQARKLAPARLSRGEKRWGRARPVEIRVHAGPGYRARHGDWLAHFRDQVERANEVLRPAFELRLEIRDAPEWEPKSDLGDLDALLAELESHDAGDDVGWVVGLVGSQPRAMLSFDELGRARLLGKHIVLRDMNDDSERKAFAEGLDTFDEEERARLYRARRQHKETVSLLHELGHTLGGIHTRETTWLMHSAYHPDMVGFAPDNRDLMWRVLHYRLQGAPQEKLLEELERYLSEAQWTGWDAQARRQVLAAIAGARAPEAAPAPATPVVGPVQIEDPADDMMTLAVEDRPRFRDARAAAKAGRGGDAEVWAAIEELAAKYPDVYAPQHLACEVALSRGGMAQARSYCERMTELAKELR